MHKTTSIQLATGILHLDVQPGRVPLQRLLGFAARVSSKRKFLLVSKILGKHYPVTPQLMRWSYRALARAVVKNQIDAGSLWIGMAETATGLGYGVYAAAVAEGLQQGLFMQTTRYHLADLDRLEFEEAHSHATDFFLYYPIQSDYRQQFLSATTLVLIDDEISTGKTFLRLIKAYQAINPHLQKVFIVSLVNFAAAADKESLETQAGVAVQWLSFRQGVLHFDDAYIKAIDQISVNVSGNGACKKHLLAWPGRLGITTPIRLDQDAVAQVLKHFHSDDRRPVLVLGTGECNSPAFLLACALEAKGFNVKVQSTTRSPIYQGNDIGAVSQFTDNYKDGIANFIYNLHVDAYREIIICHETPLCAALNERLQQWQAISARFELMPDSTYAKLHFFRP
ncbi:MAG: phosphoribosyltransferase domain-containing protein [Methylococcales bacterium]